MKKIAILCHDLSNNALGRALVLAELLEKDFQIQILGPKFGKEIWQPAIQHIVKYNITEIDISVRAFIKNCHKVDADLIYAVKPFFTSFGYGLILKFRKKIKLILDEDDWDLGFFLDLPITKQIQSLSSFLYLNNFFYTWIFSHLTFLADAITVSSKFLQQKFGGEIIIHARKGREMKKKPNNNVQNPKVATVMFLGTVRKHKGISQIVNALDNIGGIKFTFWIIGCDKESLQYIPERSYIKITPQIPLNEVSDYLNLADIIVLPQQKSNASLGQIPAKLFDAMAAGKAIIASNVSDLPSILYNCGIIYDLNDPSSLHDVLEKLLYDKNLRTNLGIKAKKKFTENYDVRTVRLKLISYLIKKNIT